MKKTVTEKRWGWVDIVGNLGLLERDKLKVDLLAHIGECDTPVRVTLTYEVTK